MRDKLIEPDKSTNLVNPTEGTNKEIPRQSRSRRKFQSREIVNVERLTMTVDPTKEADRSFPPIPKEILLTHASANHHIEVAMGHDTLSPPINTEELELDWHLFEHHNRRRRTQRLATTEHTQVPDDRIKAATDRQGTKNARKHQ